MILIIAIFCTNACKNDSSLPLIPEVNFEEARKTEKGFSLSEVVDELKVIKLETNKDCLIGRSNINLIFSNDHLFVSQSRSPLFVFNADGKFIRSIGTIGRGPGEIEESYNFSFNPTDSTVLFFGGSRNSILVYSFNGKYLRDINIDQRILSLKYLKKDLFYAALYLLPEADTLGYNHIIFNHMGEIVDKYYLKGYTQPNFGSTDYPAYVRPSPIATEINDEIYIYSTFNDTIFKISKDKKIIPCITWGKGKYTPPGGLTSNSTMSSSDEENYIFELGDFGRIGDYWFFGVPFPNDYSLIFYNESNGESFKLTRMTNDIDGTIWTLPHRGNAFNNTFVSLYDPTSLKSMLKSGRYDNTDIMYPDRNKTFKELVRSLDENDNPIAVIFTMKR